MTKVLEKHHKAKFPGAQIDIDAGFTFEALLIAAHAWLAAKSTKPDALMEALRKTKIDDHVMVGGPIEFDAKGQNVNIKGTALQNLKRKPTWCCPRTPPRPSSPSRSRAGTTSGGLEPRGSRVPQPGGAGPTAASAHPTAAHGPRRPTAPVEHLPLLRREEWASVHHALKP